MIMKGNGLNRFWFNFYKVPWNAKGFHAAYWIFITTYDLIFDKIFF